MNDKVILCLIAFFGLLIIGITIGVLLWKKFGVKSNNFNAIKYYIGIPALISMTIGVFLIDWILG